MQRMRAGEASSRLLNRTMDAGQPGRADAAAGAVGSEQRAGAFVRRLLAAQAESDPGRLRLIHAAKTGLAVLVALLLFYRADLQVRLFAAIGAGFLMQC